MANIECSSCRLYNGAFKPAQKDRLKEKCYSATQFRCHPKKKIAEFTCKRRCHRIKVIVIRHDVDIIAVFIDRFDVVRIESDAFGRCNGDAQ